jgi:hypothetical protein
MGGTWRTDRVDGHGRYASPQAKRRWDLDIAAGQVKASHAWEEDVDHRSILG